MGQAGRVETGQIDAGRVLRAARERAGINQSELARRSGTARSALAGYESGRRAPSTATLNKLLAACGLQARVTLEPLLADVDALAAALDRPVAELDVDRWQRLADTLDDVPGAITLLGWTPPRRGPVPWAVDGGSALVAQGLAAEPPAAEVVVELGEALRFWMMAVSLMAHGRWGLGLRAWYDVDAEEMRELLQETCFSHIGFVRVRLVDRLPPTLPIAVSWREAPLPVLGLDQVELAHSSWGTLLARRRELMGSAEGRGSGRSLGG